MEVKEEDQVLQEFDVMETAASSKLGLQVVEALREERDALYRIYSFHGVDFREIADEHEITHGESLLGFADLVLSDLPYSVRSVREDAISHYNVLASEDMADAVPLCKGVIRRETHSHLSCSALQFGQ